MGRLKVDVQISYVFSKQTMEEAVIFCVPTGGLDRWNANADRDVANHHPLSAAENQLKVLDQASAVTTLVWDGSDYLQGRS